MEETPLPYTIREVDAALKLQSWALRRAPSHRQSAARMHVIHCIDLLLDRRLWLAAKRRKSSDGG